MGREGYRALCENPEGGAPIEDFLEWFPGVTREQALAVLRYGEEMLPMSNGWRFGSGQNLPCQTHGDLETYAGSGFGALPKQCL